LVLRLWALRVVASQLTVGIFMKLSTNIHHAIGRTDIDNVLWVRVQSQGQGQGHLVQLLVSLVYGYAYRCVNVVWQWTDGG